MMGTFHEIGIKRKCVLDNSAKTDHAMLRKGASDDKQFEDPRRRSGCGRRGHKSVDELRPNSYENLVD